MKKTRKIMQTVEDLRERCTLVKPPPGMQGQCWIWGGASSGPRPAARVRPLGAEKSEFRRGASIAAALAGKELPHGKVWTMRCGVDYCLCPAHVKAATPGEIMRRAAKGIDIKARTRRASETRIARGIDCPLWMREWAIESPQSAPVAAAALGLCPSTVRQWRRAALNRMALLALDPFQVSAAMAAGVSVTEMLAASQPSMRPWRPLPAHAVPVEILPMMRMEFA